MARVAIAYTNNIKKIMYVNGKMNHESTVRQDRMKTTKGGHFSLLGDNDGEDFEVDISYAAIYDRMLTAAEIAELHSRPLAQRADESFVPTLAPAGVWVADGNGGLATSKGMPLTAVGNGYTWTRTAVTNVATYVADITLPAVQTDGGVLAMNVSGVASGIYGTGSTYSGSFTTTTSAGNFLANTTVGKWGYWTENALDRTYPHRVAVTWAANGRVHYYVDGRPWGQITPTDGDTSLQPSDTMTFLDGLASGVTRFAAYDATLTPDEVAALGGAGTSFSGNAPNAPTVSATVPADPVKALVDPVTFTVSGTHPDGEYISFAIDFGDGTGDCTSELVPSGSSVTFSHKYIAVGTMTPRVKTISQNDVESAWTSLATPFEVVSVSVAARDVLLTWPWQQNVYTNRFTIMCEGVKDTEDATRWDGLEVQYGAGYAQHATMSRVEGNGTTWIYTAHITIDGADGQTIPYRLGYYGLPLTFDDPADDTAGTVKLWSQDENESFTCAIWGDNQQGGNTYDWGSDKFLYVTRLFEHMVSQDVDFGISTGDMASNANYANEIRPCILDRTDAIFGRTRPYYVAWGNHDTGFPANKPYFETGAVDEPAYGTSASGNYYLYRGNVLFIFIDNGLMTAAATQTWLADLLATDRARAAKFRILAQHVPFWLECWGGHNSIALLETAKAGGIDLVLSGHMHGYERIHKDGIVQLTNGGAGYLDHLESVSVSYGDATFIGGHRDVPYLWARQKSTDETNVIGPAEPVRMGCIQSYGELKVDGATLTYTAHGFHADGSYIGVFDEFSLTSRTVIATAPSPSSSITCADPSTFAQFTSASVTNAKWKEYKDAVGEAFTYAEGAGADPVVNVSKNEIEKFLVWLNGANGDYRLPTAGELETVFGGELRRDVAEWTSSVDPRTGWCRILGSPLCAADGTWCREADKPSIATAGCHANYLGFRLATGAAPAEPAAPGASLAPALASLEQIAAPAAVYKWQNNTLVDITAEWTNPASDLSYQVPVIFTGKGVISNNPTAFNVTFHAGLAAPYSTQLVKSGEGALTVKGVVKGGVCDSEGGWVIASEGPLSFEDVVFAGQGVQFRSGDRALLLKGDNDFSGADIFLNGANNNCTNYVASSTPATFRARRITNKGANPSGIGENLSLILSKDIRFSGGYTMHIDGSLDAEAFNMFTNNDPWLFGAGTLRVGYFGTYDHSWIRLAVSNAVFTTARPLRSNHEKYYSGVLRGRGCRAPVLHLRLGDRRERQLRKTRLHSCEYHACRPS
ncbi:MAG: metallophosphoesterase [Kiritimatiellae bacterium]|nr:metallophosphoesterase [Kiritimatiellia bacterium]